jgi:3-oxoacid CoA-transferase subunit A
MASQPGATLVRLVSADAARAGLVIRSQKGALIDISAVALCRSPGSCLDARPIPARQIRRDRVANFGGVRVCLSLWAEERLMNKVYPDASGALAGLLRDGMTIMSGGFGLCGIPELLVAAIRDSGVTGLTMISNNAGIDGAGLGLLLESRQIRKMISSYVGENQLFADLYLKGELEIEFNPQGTLAERIRAGGAGIPAFFTKTGVGTLVAEGKEIREFDSESYVMERSLVADLAIIHAWKADREGNLVYRKTARNFNPVMATAGRVTVAEVENLVEPGTIDPDHIHTPGIFVDRIIHAISLEKRIEQRTVRSRRN